METTSTVVKTNKEGPMGSATMFEVATTMPATCREEGQIRLKVTVETNK